jgi:transcriptional regulator with XRE-family HTH domain
MSIPFSAVSQNLRANLAALRELRGLTQVELGSRAAIAAASISHFETGQRIPSLDSLIRLADALDVSVDALLGRVPLEASVPVDPIFVRASKASADTLDTLRRVTAALLAGEKK